MNASRTFTLLAVCALGLAGCPADPEPGNTGASSTTSTTPPPPDTDQCATGGLSDECCPININYCPPGYSSSTTLDCSTDACWSDSSTTLDCSTDACWSDSSTTLDCSTGGCDSSTTVDCSTDGCSFESSTTVGPGFGTSSSSGFDTYTSGGTGG